LKVGLFSPSAVSKRISVLKKSGLIKRTGAVIDYAKLGYTFTEKDLLPQQSQARSRLPSTLSAFLCSHSFHRQKTPCKYI
jgi:DNA-binding Lrp family transcriptional regulator